MKVCRICLVEVPKGAKHHSINEVEEQSGFMPFRDKLTLCVPELAIDVVSDPIICQPCSINLQVAHDFKRLCLESEEKVLEFIRNRNSENSLIDLTEYRSWVKKNKAPSDNKLAKINEGPVMFKEEVYVDDYKKLRSILEKLNNSKPTQIVEINTDISRLKIPECMSLESVSPLSNNSKHFVDVQDIKNEEKIDVNFKLDPNSELRILKEEELDFSNSYYNEEIVEVTNNEDSGSGSDSEFLGQIKKEDLLKTFIQCVELDADKTETYMCKICTRKFDWRNLKNHYLVHKERPRFTCDTCSRTFKAIHYLHRHLRTHTNLNEHPFKCRECNKVFKYKSSLTKHTHGVWNSPGKIIKRRITLPKEAKKIMRKWLYDHRDNPYPTDKEKKEIVKQTNLKYIQVENWFVNARRRILNKDIIIEDNT